MTRTLPQAEHPCSFDEFKLYYESTEQVTERRLAANRWNYSISVAILLAVAGIYSWTAKNQNYLLIGALVILFITAIAALFSLFWLRQVEDWKALNSAKFQVLSEMAARVRFDGKNGPSDAESYRPFDKEWQILQRNERLTKVRIMKLGQLEALNASGAELFMPRAFASLFTLIFVATVATILLSWSTVPHHLAPVNTPSPPSSTTKSIPVRPAHISPSMAPESGR